MSNLNSAAKEFVPATFHPPPLPPTYESYDMNGGGNGYAYVPQQLPPSYPPQYSQAMAYGQRTAFVPDHHYNNQYMQAPKDMYNNGGNYRAYNGGGRGPRPNRNNYQQIVSNRDSNIAPVKLENSTLSTASPAYVPSVAAIAAAIAISQSGDDVVTTTYNDNMKNVSITMENPDGTLSENHTTSGATSSAAAAITVAAITATSTASATTSLATTTAAAAITTSATTTATATTISATTSAAAITTSTTYSTTASATIATTTSTTTPATTSATTTTTTTTSSATTSTAASQGWRRSTPDIATIPRATVTSTPSPAGVSPSTSSLWTRAKSNVLRYDRATIMSLFIRDQEIPPELKLVFVEKHLRERVPIDPNVALPSSPKKEEIESANAGTTEESPTIERKDVFRFDPSRFGDPNSDSAKLLKSRSVLNKLTPEKYDKLTKEYMEIGLDTSNELLQSAVNLIVKKAQMEESFSFMYGNLCKTLWTSWTRSVPATSTQTMTLGEEFRLALLKSCEEEFNIENRKKAYEDIALMDIPEEVKTEKYALLRRCYTGHMRFVGEIYKQDIVKASIMRDCLDELIATTDEDKLLCLCKLFAVIGEKLEAYEKQKKKGSKINAYFKTIQSLIDGTDESKVITSLVRYSLKELCELRKNNWVERRAELKAQTIAEIRGEVTPGSVAAAAAAAAAASAASTSSSKSTADDTKSSKAKVPEEEEWKTVTSGGKKKSSSSATASSNNANTATQRQASNGKQLHHDIKDKDKPKKTIKETPVTRNSSTASAPFGGMFGALAAGGGGGSGKEKKEKKKDKEKEKKEKSSKKTSSSSGKSSKKKEEEEEDVEGEGGEEENEENNKEATDAGEGNVGGSEIVEEQEEEVDAMPHISKEALMKKIKSSVNDLIEEQDTQTICEELVVEIKGLIPSSQMRDFFKYLLEYISENDVDCYEKLCLLLTRLHETGVLTMKQIQKGLFGFLEVYPDFVVDAPKALVHVPAVIGKLLLTTSLDLSDFSHLSYDPIINDDPNCSVFLRYIELFFIILDIVHKQSDIDRAKKVYVDSKLQISDILHKRVSADEVDAILTEDVEKYSQLLKLYE